ncbi:hypothetical protein HN587_01525 [Candidatus Woesearchaeota archaeon]|nr:hypothetical protein [Candidatus Woesearchaeota archaeon]
MADLIQLTPEEFLVVRHSVLNGNSYDVEKLVEDTLNLAPHLNGRTPIPCFEGDLIQVKETGEVVLTHQNFKQLTQKKFQELREKGIAASLDEVLDRIDAFRQVNLDQRLVLCFEPKFITTSDTILDTVYRLDERKFHDVYFDSFFNGQLGFVSEANKLNRTNYGRSLHLIGNVGRFGIACTGDSNGYETATIPITMSFGDFGQPVIYGAVGSTKILQRIAKDPQTLGAYVRLKEGAGVSGALKKLWNSVTNTEQLRKTTISLYGPA